MTCKHQFIKIDEIDRGFGNDFRPTHGAIIGCANCGEVRHLFANGVLRMVVEGRGKKEDE